MNTKDARSEVDNRITAKHILEWSTHKLAAHYDLYDRDVLVLEEMLTGDWLGQNGRADLAFISEGWLAGIEVKAATDNLNRLERQIKDYEATFDECWLSCHQKHVSHALEILPIEWGILSASRRDGLELVRAAIPHGRCTAKAALHRIWVIDVKTLARNWPHWPQDGTKPAWYGKSGLMDRLLESADNDESQQFLRKEAWLLYQKRRVVDRKVNAYGPTHTLEEALDMFQHSGQRSGQMD